MDIFKGGLKAFLWNGFNNIPLRFFTMLTLLHHILHSCLREVAMRMDLYLYSAFLVLMTTQSSLQYSFTFTQSHTHTVHLLAALCCSMRPNSGFSILLKDTSACRFGKTGDRTADCLQVGGRPLYPLSHSRPKRVTCVNFNNSSETNQVTPWYTTLGMS